MNLHLIIQKCMTLFLKVQKWKNVQNSIFKKLIRKVLILLK